MDEISDTRGPEQRDWANLTPEQRFEEYTRLFAFYRAAGGSLEPEHDSQSPFDFDEYYTPRRQKQKTQV